MRQIKATLLVLIYLLYVPQITAKNLGVIGHAYPIAEMNFLEWIQTRLQEKINNGELAQWQTAQNTSMHAYADRPTPVAGLTPAQQHKSWLYDPTLTLMHDVYDAEGNIKLSAGTRLNPLDHVTWTNTLLFYDGDDAAQVNWVMQINQQLKGHVMLILTQGSISEQTTKLKKRVYFDQGGQLVQRFGITHLPASVMQDEKQLRITEIKI